MNRRWLLSSLRFLFVTGVVACVSLVYGKLIHVNPTTVALTFLLGILFVANRLGLRYSVYMSVIAALAFNLFFLPPTGTLTIADTQNWVALLAFLTAGVLASHLSERVKKEARAANQRRQEVERLYELSQKMLTSDRATDLLNSIPAYISSTFHNTAANIFLLEHDQVYQSLTDTGQWNKEDLYDVTIHSETRYDKEVDFCIAPLLLGLQPIGALAITGNLPSRETIDALGSLIAISIERSLTAERLARTEAAQESERLRTALLDSVTHQLRTPLTAITASITSLRSGMIQDPQMKEEMLEVIDEESIRLNRLIGQAVEMAQLDSHQVQLRLEPKQIRDVIQETISHPDPVLQKHKIEINIPPSTPPVKIDADWIRKVVHHLLENAAKYSDDGKPITISTAVKDSMLITSITDQGVGIDDADKPLIFDKFYRGQSQRYRVQGTGMGLAIVRAIIEAHGGRVTVTSQRDVGSTFSFSLPLA